MAKTSLMNNTWEVDQEKKVAVEKKSPAEASYLAVKDATRKSRNRQPLFVFTLIIAKPKVKS